MEDFISLLKSDPKQSILDHFDKISDKDIFTKNYFLLLKTLGESVTTNIASTKEIQPDYREILLEPVLEGGWNCHFTSAYLSIINNKVDYFFGFTDQFRDDNYVHTFCHSFLMAKDRKKFYDPYIEFKYLESFPYSTRNYFGVYIPTGFVNAIFFSEGLKKQINPSWYIKHLILTSEEKTNHFVKRIQDFSSKTLTV